MARLFRGSPLNSIWEGSGNIVALDVVRTIRGSGGKNSFKALEDNMEGVKGLDKNLDKHWEITLDMMERLALDTTDQAVAEFYGRKIAADIAVGMQGVEMVRGSVDNIVEDDEAGMFVASRIGEGEEGELNPNRGIYGNAMTLF
jgi:putative acyl-CoA dehydrogenase